ncbi:POLR3A [Cordylochernes scorpioides]|uniref:DNA-directed RNA polymerase n=1 Tax=Cordylochernes scorpioides TaxID=51811 RepID=A0ABY6K8G2_9ARAC|nr:POLR3A [Cordylochernes scorpioides]
MGHLFLKDTLALQLDVVLYREVLNPFYLFQGVSILLWSLDNYYIYASCIFVLGFLSIVISLVETKKIPPGGCHMPCDAVLLEGSCIVNESMLTGFTTTKGSLIRSIMHPPPVGFKFYRDALKFVTFLGVVSAFGMAFSLYLYISRGSRGVTVEQQGSGTFSSLKDIIVRSLDLVTIVVPPALPAAMTVGTVYAQRRLKKQGIYCISPQHINIGGKIKLYCFDKTLTYADACGLMVLRFQDPVTDPATLGDRDPLKISMATCHGLTLIDGKLCGDPLDLNMFEATTWMPYEVGIIRQFPFSSSLQRMAVICRTLGDRNMSIYVKGAPEKIASLCSPETLPDDFHTLLQKYTKKGYRVIALAWKPLSSKLTWHHAEKAKREEFEESLRFLGLLVMQNMMKSETKAIIKELQQARIRTVMITGDNLLTAVSVALDSQMIPTSDQVIVIHADPSKQKLDFEYLEFDHFKIGISTIECYFTRNFTAKRYYGGDDRHRLVPIGSRLRTFGFCSTLKRDRDGEFPEIEEALFRWIRQANAMKLAINGNILKEKAILLALKKMGQDNFEASNGWLEKFKARRNIAFKRLHGEAGSVDANSVATWKEVRNVKGALKAADIGISLSEAEASVAAPFTSNVPNISCVPKLIKEGRCSLVTTFSNFKFISMYSLIQFASVILLYIYKTNLTDFMFLYIDIGIITVVAFLMGSGGPYETLVPKRPRGSLINIHTLLSLFFQLVWFVMVQGIGIYMLRSEPWYVDPGTDDDSIFPNYANTVIFLITIFQYVTQGMIFSKGAPFRKPIYRSYLYAIALFLITGCNVFLFFNPFPKLSKYFQMQYWPLDIHLNFKLYLFALVGIYIVGAAILEVTKHNLERMKMLVRNGTEKFPGAISITRKNGQMKMLAFRNLEGRMKDAEELMMGDIVKRNMVDGDFVLFNRQPSLHKLSIMCHQVRVLPYRTLQFNESVCTPYNADFDGDEMNIHLPQTEEARAEAMVLLQSKNNLITPKNGEMVIGAIQDFITGSFLMTHKDTFLSFAEMLAIIGSLSLTYSRDEICIPMPHIIKPIPLWSGKQLFSLIIRPNSHSPIKINFETKTKMNTKRDDICPEDTIVIIRNSELLCGYVDKSLIGSGTKKGIFYSLFCDYNQDIAAEAMWRLSTWMSSFLSRRGFSIGIGDVTPSSSLLKSKNNLLTNGYTKCDDYIALHADGNLPTDPGCTKDQTLEAKLLKTLSDLRQSAGEACFEALPWTNSPRIMSISGSKGSLINISQMIAMVGQQALNGHRVPDKFINRTLPHSLPFSKTPKVKGFVKNSFYSGLVASEMFFHTMAGREGLVDTAVKTADTGYMQRRLMKSLEDLVCHYDSSIRTISGKILQFTYGGDGLNPELMEGDDCLVNYVRLFKHVQSITGSTGNSSILTNHAIKTFIDSEFESEPFKKNANLKIKYDLQEFFGESCSNFPKNQPVTKEHLIRFFTEIYNRKQRAILPGGTAIGALCAQSLGEPTTQMTLKTFHFAGVASMSITQGVPRIQEIINANKNIKTPIITAPLKATSLNEAYESQWQVERSTLESISVDISIRFTSNMEEGSYIHVHLVDDPKLNIDEIVNAIENQITNITFNQIKIINSTNIAVFPSPKMINAAKGTVLIALYKLRSKLIKVNARGIKTVNKAVISEIADKKGNKKFSLLIDGLGLSRVLGISGIEPYSTVSNHIKEMAEVLGVEAARNMIIKEIKSVTTNYGIGIDIRHLELLADLMTSTGDILLSKEQLIVFLKLLSSAKKDQLKAYPKV